MDKAQQHVTNLAEIFFQGAIRIVDIQTTAARVLLQTQGRSAAMFGAPDGTKSKSCTKGYRQLAGETHLDKDTVRDLISEFKDKGIVREIGTYDPDTRSGTPGAEKVKVKGNIHWVSVQHACAAQVRLYDRLFKAAHPGAGDRPFQDDLNPDSRTVITAQLDPLLGKAAPEDRFQFERHGYFVADLRDSRPGSPVFNRAVTLRDSWGKAAG